MDQLDGANIRKDGMFDRDRSQQTFNKMQPDRGWTWVVCFGAHMWNVLVGGTLKLNGVIFVEFQELFNDGATATSWIGFSFGICMLSGAFISGCIVDNISHQTLRIYLVVVAILTAVSVALSGYMATLPPTIVTYGVLFGLLIGLGDVAALSRISLYFVKRRTLAYSLAFFGSPIGSLILPLMFATTSDYCGFRGSMLIFSAMWLHGLLLPVFSWPMPAEHTQDNITRVGYRKVSQRSECTASDHEETCAEQKTEDSYQIDNDSLTAGSAMVSLSLQQSEHGPRGDTHVKRKSRHHHLKKIFASYGRFLSSPGIPFLVMSVFFGFFAYIGGFFIIPPLALQMEMDKLQTSTILTVASVAEMISKVMIGVLVDRCHVSRTVILLSTYAATGVVAIVVSLVSNPYGLYGYGIAVGGFAGSVVCLGIPMMMNLTDDTQRGSASGLFSFSAGLASALVPTIYGSVRDGVGTYTVCLYLGAAANFLGIIFYFGTRICKR